MKILVVGGGGREHALVWKIAQSPLLTKLYAAPGNPGIAKLATCIDIAAENVEGLLEFALKEKIDLTVVGPEAPLVKGIVDLFEARGLLIVGPSQAAAELEGSKVFCKTLLRREGIPTANFRAFNDAPSARQFINSSSMPVAVKADGLAAGKGVFVCRTTAEAHDAVDAIMVKKSFGTAGNQVVIEEFLAGVEASVIAITDGRNIIVLDSAQDHKRIYDGDRGPNTGGMGAYSPAPVAPDREYQRVVKEVIVQTIHGMNAAGRRFRGVLYAGIMFTKSGPKVLEFNVRFGDPETQPLMMRIKGDLVPVLKACAEQRMQDIDIDWDPRPAVCVVMASNGYPGKYETGFPIEGIEAAEALGDVVVFHGGTALKDGKLVTSGGRVLGVTAVADTIVAAQARAYEAVGKISFRGAYVRTDIAGQAVARDKSSRPT